MKNIIIGIAGGSGCGKSTLAYGLKDKYPDLVEVIHFDDYMREEQDVPMFKGMRNWDHPDTIDFDRLYGDLNKLLDGNQVKIMTKSGILNPEYEEKGRIPIVLEPKKIMIVEGYMALYDKRVSGLMDLKIFLDIPIEKSMERRDKITYNDESVYNKEILIPMHNKYVNPTKDIADMKIDVLKNNQDSVFDIVEQRLIELDIIKIV